MVEDFRYIRIFRIPIFLLLSSVVLVGCVPQLGSGGVPIGAQEFVQGKVVLGFPSLPLYPDGKVIESYGYKFSYGASFISDDELVKVVKFYNEALPTLQWESSLKEMSPTNYVFDIKNSEMTGTVIVNTAADGEKTAITMSVTGR